MYVDGGANEMINRREMNDCAAWPFLCQKEATSREASKWNDSFAVKHGRSSLSIANKYDPSLSPAIIHLCWYYRGLK
jgi:hypothetical protein